MEPTIICPYQVKDWGPTNRPQMTTDHHGCPQMTTDDHHLECKNSQNGVILGRSNEIVKIAKPHRAT